MEILCLWATKNSFDQTSLFDGSKGQKCLKGLNKANYSGYKIGSVNVLKKSILKISLVLRKYCIHSGDSVRQGRVDPIPYTTLSLKDFNHKTGLQ